MKRYITKELSYFLKKEKLYSKFRALIDDEEVRSLGYVGIYNVLANHSLSKKEREFWENVNRSYLRYLAVLLYNFNLSDNKNNYGTA